MVRIKPFCLLLSGLASVSPAQALESAPITTAHAQVRLTSEVDAFEPGKPFRLGLHFKLAQGWHIYWSNPGSAGQPPEVEFVLPEGAKASEIAWPTPLRVPEGPAMTYSYLDEALLPLTLTTPPGLASLAIKARASWLICEKICVPEEGELRLDLPVGAPKPSAEAPLFAAADARIPVPSPYAATVSADGVLSLAGGDGSLATVRHASFLPTAWGEIDDLAPQTSSFADGKLTPKLLWPNGTTIGMPASNPFPDSPDVVAVGVGDPAHSNNVAVVKDGQLQKITFEGDAQLAGINLGETKVVHWTSKEGVKLEGIATFPPGYTTGKRYPFLVFPHGGPEANDQLGLDPMAKYIAGKNYVVLQPEYRGSTGYGAAHLAAIYQHFGDRAYRDVDSATDFAIAQGWADPARLAIFGWSAGGFMTSWTVTQTHRYKAAIEGAGITDWLSFIPTSDTWQTDYDARLQEKDPSPMLKFSAVMFADRVTTPLLILHGSADVRVPTFQGFEFYALLKERGKTVRMVTYPGSPHFPRLAEQRRDVLDEVGCWLDKYNP